MVQEWFRDGLGMESQAPRASPRGFQKLSEGSRAGKGSQTLSESCRQLTNFNPRERGTQI
eukprot:12411059-Karenia_brevis.AAC.1